MTIIIGIAAAALATGILSTIADTEEVDGTDGKTYTVIEKKGFTGTHNEERKA